MFGGGGGAALLNKCNNSHALQNKSIFTNASLVFWGAKAPSWPPGISVLACHNNLPLLGKLRERQVGCGQYTDMTIHEKSRY